MIDMMEEPATSTIWRPQYRMDGSLGPQFALMMCPADEIFFGGSRGGGKTAAMLGHFLAHAQKYGSKARGIFFRRRFTQLQEVQRQASELYPKLGATYSKSDATWTFPNGATLRLGHLWDSLAADSYQGWALTWICFEELTNWPSLEPMDKMRGCLRSSDGVKCVLLATGNPGGPGHNVVKQRYVDPAPGGFQPLTDPETGQTRVFIPSRLEDNPALMRNDPGYERRLMALGNPQLVRAWRYGDWAVTFGGAFDDLWRPDKHVIRPFPFPPGYTFRRSFDWGSAAPSAFQMWAISDGSPIRELGGFVFPRGSVILFGEWYTVAKAANGDVKPNVGLRLTNQALGRGIAERSKGWVWSGCVADPSIFAEPGRESIYADMQRGAREAGLGFTFTRADNERVAGWQKMREMMEAAAADVPERAGLWVFDNCSNFLRTVPTLQRDDARPDDIDTDQEDHCIHGDTLVETGLGHVPIRDLVGTTGRIRTIGGEWREYYDCRKTRSGAPVVKVTTSDNRQIICTPDHRLLTEKGWIEAKDALNKTITDVSDYDMITDRISKDHCSHDCYSNQQHHTGVSWRAFLLVSLLFSEARKALASCGVGGSSRADTEGLSRASCGRRPSQQSVGQFDTDVRFGALGGAYDRSGPEGNGAEILATGTASGGRMAWFGSRAGLAQDAFREGLRGHIARQGAEGMRSLWRRVRDNSIALNLIPLLLKQLQIGLSQSIRRGQRNAPVLGVLHAVHGRPLLEDKDVQQEMRLGTQAGSTVVSVEPAGIADVYNLEVEQTHCFAVAGGLIVHNCGDAARYLVMSRNRKMVQGTYSVG